MVRFSLDRIVQVHKINQIHNFGQRLSALLQPLEIGAAQKLDGFAKTRVRNHVLGD